MIIINIWLKFIKNYLSSYFNYWIVLKYSIYEKKYFDILNSVWCTVGSLQIF